MTSDECLWLLLTMGMTKKEDNMVIKIFTSREQLELTTWSAPNLAFY